MTSAKEGKAAPPLRPSGVEDGLRRPLDLLPPPANSNKPLTPFSIEDILSKPSGPKAPAARLLDKLTGSSAGPRSGTPAPASPLCALEELATKTFKGLEVNVLQAAEGRDPLGAFGPRQPSKKRRKSRTAFTNHQIYELEKRFLYQKYLSPADRDHIAAQLGLSNAQVITWFQNRRAKLKRDLEEMKADVESLKKLPPAALEKLASMPELEPEPQAQPARPRSGSLPRASPPSSPGASLSAKDDFSDGEDDDHEEEEEEIDVGD
ncbi:transcription factor LBX2 [Eublepharis macularius]|uniref:Transcription factor LBX2 n=1 Tax=Eublepharis macularius TaxID=481883 RepID=A0AA97JYB1_EUBMA|nr:transcription factor LBX2 [Eublepharis macularius]